MLEQRRLDLDGGDHLAAGDEEVLDPVHDADAPLGVALGEVARVQPAVGEGDRRRVRVLEISGHDARTAHEELPGARTGAADAVLGEEGHLDEGVGEADAPGVAARLCERQAGDVGPGLAQPVALDERHPTVVPHPQQRHRRGAAADDGDAKAGQVAVEELRVLGEEEIARRHAHHRGHPVLLDEPQGATGLEPALEDEGAADPQGEEGLHVPPADVVLRHDREDNVGLRERQHPPEGLVGPVAVGVGEHDRLAVTGRP